jgi:hypothetical protein
MVALGDVPTWLLVVIGAVGGGAALWQLGLQRRQLRDQQEVIARQTRQLERAQADAIDFSWRPSAPLGQTAEAQKEEIWMGVVHNGSRRPIRDVVCRIEPGPAQGFDLGAQGVGELVDVGMGSGASMPVFASPKLGDRVPLIRRDAIYGFKTEIPVKGHGVARMKVRFTDDAGLHWEIDPDLHLEKLAKRDW